MVIGDLRYESFKEIFNSERMIQIQELHAKGNADLLPLCVICDQRNSHQSKIENLIYNSAHSAEKRIRATSTEYDLLVDGRR